MKDKPPQPMPVEPPLLRIAKALLLVGLTVPALLGVFLQSSVEPMILLSVVCAFGCPFAVGALSLWGDPRTRLPVFVAGTLSVVFWMIPALVSFAAASLWAVYCFAIVGLCFLASWGALRGLRRDGCYIPEKDGEAESRRVSFTRVFPPFIWPVLLAFTILELKVLLFTDEFLRNAFALWTINFVGASAVACVAVRYVRVSRDFASLGNVPYVAVIFGVLAASILPGIGRARLEGPHIQQCEERLTDIARALDKYAQQHGHYPPAVQLDRDGKPTTSWRALIAPYLPFAEPSSYRFEEPWNSPRNLQVARDVGARHFWPPKQRGLRENTDKTRFLAVVGEDLFWLPDGRVRKKGELECPERIPVLIEVVDSDVVWTEPQDMHVDDILSGTFDFSRTNAHPQTDGFFVHKSPYTHILFADGRSRMFRGRPNKDELARLFSSDAPLGSAEDDPITFADPGIERHWPHVAMFGVWIGCWVLTIVWAFAPVRK